MDDIIQCGNDLRFIESWLHHHGPGDPILHNLAVLTQSMVQMLAASQIANQKLGREFRFEAAQAVQSAAKQFASANAVTANA